MQKLARFFTNARSIGPILILLFVAAKSDYGRSHRSTEPLDAVKLLSWDENTLALEITGAEVYLEHLEIDGRSYQKPRILNWPSLDQAGKPDLPALFIPVALPPGKEIGTVEVAAAQVESSLVPAIVPAPALVIRYQDNEPYPIESFITDSQIYQRNAFYPEIPYQISSLGKLAGIEVAQLEVFPVTYNPVTGELQIAKIIRLRVEFRTATQSALGRPVQDPIRAIEQLQNLVMNKDQLIASLKNGAPVQPKTTMTAAPDSRPALRIVIDREGIYRLSYSELRDAGIPVSSLVPGSFRMTNRGIEQAIFVAGEADGRFDEIDYIDFYGQPNRGDSCYYDMYMNDNVYWLTWGDVAGQRFRDLMTSPAQGPAKAFYLETLHIEEENNYYAGDDDVAIWNTNQASGEGWIWQYLFAKDELSVTANLMNVHFDTIKSLIRIRLRGTTLSSDNPDHHFKFYLNNQYLGESFFNDRETITFETQFPTGWLSSGDNRIKLYSVGTSAALDQCYLDWIEIRYPRKFQVNDDMLSFKPVTTERQNINMGTFKSKNVVIYDITNSTRLANFQLLDTLRISALVLSAGVSDGNSAKIVVNGQTRLLGGGRGLNVIMLDIKTGSVTINRSFDTYGSREQSDSLAALIEQTVEQTPIFIAVRDEASVNLTPRARAAIRTLGSVFIDSLGYSDSFAFIGKKGLATGQALEAWKRSGQGYVTVEGEVIVENTGRNYQLSFAAELSAQQRYIACSDSGVLKPIRLKLNRGTLWQLPAVGADYIIITHEKFLDAANELAEYRSQHNDFRVKVVEVQDIYDEFNYGLKNPAALQAFLRYARDNWIAPAPHYVCLFGDASWDYKMNSKASNKIDYVPSYGQPVSDVWLVCLDGPNDLLPDLNVGRLSIESGEEAQAIINKIKTYEKQTTEVWNKQFLFVSGGTNSYEHQLFESQNQFLYNNYIKPAPVAGHGEIISKAKYESSQISASEMITQKLNQGCLWLNFIGHGASSTWDLIYNDSNIEDLNNSDRLPFITSMTCHTARFANPQSNCFGETFLKKPERGCIGFWGSTGWGFTDQDEKIINLLFESAFHDTIFDIGAALTRTKIKYSSISAKNIRTLSTFYQFSLLGDPALKLALAPRPDLAFRNDAITVQPAIPTEDDSLVYLKLRIWNLGLATTDSVEIAGVDIYNGQVRPGILGKVQLGPIAYLDSVQLTWPVVGTVGRHLLRFEVNPARQIDELSPQNNRFEISVDIFPSQLTISQPYRYQMVPTRRIRLTINNPAIPAQRLYFFELDTLATFKSPYLQHSDPIPEGFLVTRWQIQVLPEYREYFWRCRYLDGRKYSNWEHSVFYTTHTEDIFDWQQRGVFDFTENRLLNAYIHADGYVTQVPTLSIIKAESEGLYQGRTFADISLNGTSLMVTARGHNLAVFDPVTGLALDTEIFDTWLSTAEADRMGSYIAQLPPGRVVAIAIRDDGSRSMTQTAFSALESIGSQYSRQVGYHDSWAIVGMKGAAIGTAAEQWLKVGAGMATARDSVSLLPEKSSMLSPVIGPASHWNSIHLETLAPSTSISLDVFGYNRSSARWDSVKLNLTGPQIDLSDLSAKQYPKIQLRANLIKKNHQQAAKLSAWQVDYDPVPDLAIGYPSVTLSADSLIIGEPLNIHTTILNVGQKEARSVQMEITISDPDSGKIAIGASETLAVLPPDSSIQISRKWQRLHKTGQKQLEVQVDPEDSLIELFEFNNTCAKTLVVYPDTIKPFIQVTFDGREILFGDYVSVTPQIIGYIHDNNTAATLDTTAVSLLLDGNRVSYNSDILRLESMIPQNNHNSSIVMALFFTPTLAQGDHTLEVFITDAGGNKIYHRNDFQVETRMELSQVLNYPNPFQRDTWFSFYLTQPASELSIKIYTVAGRLIQHLEPGSVISGFHHISWDGRDADGDELANGVYLYRITAKGPAGKAEVIERLVIMR